MSVTGKTPTPAATPRKRAELTAFLKARRARIAPEDVGLPPGLRRRTPGLRREEVAQLSGVGVTWYTWLEQGRPINASEQVLDAIARTLRLDRAERDHLFRLADSAPGRQQPFEDCPLDPELAVILEALDPLPAVIYSARYDVMMNNRAYGALFPRIGSGRHNALWSVFVMPGCCNPFVNRRTELPRMVAVLRAGYGRHVGEPEWERFIRELSAASPDFAAMWERHDVADTGAAIKVFRHFSVGELRMASTTLAVSRAPEHRLIVYTPMDERTSERIAWLMDHPDAPVADHTH
ncbi:helix-turn-helix transcriptional regulator [Streptacidiphilus griseoplanus]|uniref:helix-turn-helix transcriptional regulator n=1 Tax=Peterkaempfera griseoplana TaxID=66896 RepID=UPI0006E13BB8|nr:helix-turn-helix transcriptional regulator [Peterkaempfera griseoplana]